MLIPLSVILFQLAQNCTAPSNKLIKLVFNDSQRPNMINNHLSRITSTAPTFKYRYGNIFEMCLTIN